jgi:hypothetical protein
MVSEKIMVVKINNDLTIGKYHRMENVNSGNKNKNVILALSFLL